MYCPMTELMCMKNDCAWWCTDFENCAITLIGESAREFSFTADDVNQDCGIRVHVTKEEVQQNGD